MGPNYTKLFKQTITVYDKDTFAKTVYRRAFFDFKKVQNVDKTGSHEANGSLIVVPGAPQPFNVGDKVYAGVGPDIADRAAWSSFIPAKVPGLVVVKYVDPKYYQGVLVHWEAGG